MERDYAKLIKALRFAFDQPCYSCVLGEKCNWGDFCFFKRSADAIEELLAFARSVARRAVDAQDDEVSAEVLCRKLYKLGIIEKDGAWWHYEPPKDEKADDKEERPDA